MRFWRDRRARDKVTEEAQGGRVVCRCEPAARHEDQWPWARGRQRAGHRAGFPRKDPCPAQVPCLLGETLVPPETPTPLSVSATAFEGWVQPGGCPGPARSGPLPSSP